MIKPEDIPEALWEAKSTLDLAAMPVGFREVVCRAILAERERCVKVCEDRAERHKAAVRQYPDDEPSRIACFEGALEALECASAIRKGGEAASISDVNAAHTFKNRED